MVPRGSWIRTVNDQCVVNLVLLLASSSQNEFDLEIQMHCVDWFLVGTSEGHLFQKLKLYLILDVLFVYMLYIYLGAGITQEDRDDVEVVYII